MMLTPVSHQTDYQPGGDLFSKVDMMLVHELTKWTANKYFHRLKKKT